MSFPEIPDINPCINLSLEETISMLVDSIVQEEKSLSKLMDVERDNILYVLNERRHKDTIIKDILDINQSVENNIQHMIKLQMLLQFKLEKVRELIPITKKAHSDSVCNTTLKEQCCCSLSGKLKGCVTNRCDVFYNQVATLQVFLPCFDIKNRSIIYTLKKDDDIFYMIAKSYDIKREYPFSDRIMLFGTGYIEKSSKRHQDINEPISFTLNIWDKNPEMFEFRMEIVSNTKPELNHDSGFVKNYNKDSCFCVQPCCNQ